MEVWSAGSSLQTCRHGGIEVRRSGGALQACRRGRVELEISGEALWTRERRVMGLLRSTALESGCRRTEVEVSRNGALEL